MEGMSANFLSKKEKDIYLKALTEELVLLRAKAEVSQEELANIIGVSRQTYGAVERRTRKMPWNMYLTLIMFYDYNFKTHSIIRGMDAFPYKLICKFNNPEEQKCLELEFFPNNAVDSIINSLDKQAMDTVKTVLMLEYNRCNNIECDAVVKLFEGVNFFIKKPTFNDVDTATAVKKLRGTVK